MIYVHWKSGKTGYVDPIEVYPKRIDEFCSNEFGKLFSSKNDVKKDPVLASGHVESQIELGNVKKVLAAGDWVKKNILRCCRRSEIIGRKLS
ncbi:MAG: hypothetical protein CMM52_01605 [Rhodospirillaceae bacterium]|nr:hypothetical protein [Rhodospirillaceae bacterium]